MRVRVLLRFVLRGAVEGARAIENMEAAAGAGADAIGYMLGGAGAGWGAVGNFLVVRVRARVRCHY